MSKSRIIIMVEGGVVQGVFSDNKDIKVDLLDYDVLDDGAFGFTGTEEEMNAELKKNQDRAKQLEADIDKMTEIY